MGVTQLLLGILLICSICGSRGNTTLPKNVSLEKNVDSTKNVIEKLPKTDTQINLVNKDTQDDSDERYKYMERTNESDSHKNKSRKHSESGRKDSSRSIDLEKIDTRDYQNNDYGSSDSQKFLGNSIRKSSPYTDFSKFTLTTPESIFDTKFEEAKQIIDPEYEEHTSDHSYDHNVNDENDDDDHTIHMDRLFGESRNKPNSTLDYKAKTKISRNNTVGDGSEYNELTVERTHNINFDSVLNFTSSDEDDIETTSKENIESTSPRVTTKKTITLTKAPASQNTHILSNKIETETIKAINLLTTEYTTNKIIKGDNEIVPKEQIHEENKMVPMESTTRWSNDTTNTTEQTDATRTTELADNDSTTTAQTTVSQETTTTEVETDIKTTTKQTTDATTTNIETTTSTFPYDLRIDTTDIPPTESTTVISTTNEIEETTISQDSRNSKSFTFVSDSTEATTEAIRVKSSTSPEDTTTTVNTESTTQFETTTLQPEPKEYDTTTVAAITVQTTTETDEARTTTEMKVAHLTTNLTGKPDWSSPTTQVPTTTSPASTTPLAQTSTITTVLPSVRNPSESTEEITEEVTEHGTSTSTEEADTTAGGDADSRDGGEEGKGKIAAIIISTVGAVCLVLLAGLLYIMRKRQKRFNYKQRCRPVGLDDYSVDNVSGYNSTRRKAERQSKRSYGNPAFDDPAVITHPLNFTALAKFATTTEEVKAEFLEIPQIIAKAHELPEGCETKNRYANVIPLPETRVFLQPIDGYPNSDYINANFVTGPKNTKNYYIACQAPMQNTVDDFWRMVWEQQTKVILMLTHLFENGVEKCVDYLPPSEVFDCNRLFGDFQVTLKKRDVKEKYIISSLQLKNMVSNSWREVTHFWYLGWPEKGVPSEENSIIAFLIEARSYMKSSTLDKNTATNGNLNGPSKTEINPVVVHCSPGTGRTGVAIACDIAIREFEQTRLVDIPKIVYRIRRDRASAVQTKEQYMFIYKVVSLYAAKLTGGALDSF